MYTFIFTLKHYNAVTESIQTEHGALQAPSFTEAMSIIESYYGEGLDEILLLSCFDSPLLLIPQTSFQDIFDSQM